MFIAIVLLRFNAVRTLNVCVVRPCTYFQLKTKLNWLYYIYILLAFRF